MSEQVQVLVAGSFPDRLNTNTALRRYLVEGFREVLGAAAVAEASLETLLPELQRHRPKLLLCLGSCPPEVVNYQPVRAACDALGTHLAFWLHDDPYEFDLAYSATDVADTIFSNDGWAVLHYDHPRAFHLPMAASVKAHARPWRDDKARDVFFCGVAFANRIAIVRDLAPRLARCRTEILGTDWPAELPFAHNRRLPNSELADACAASTVTLSLGRNLHFANRRYQLDPSTPGPRTFEAAMAGTVQLHFADSLEISDYFADGEGVLLFDDPSNFAAQLDALLGDPGYARRIAEAGQARARRDHTYARRAEVILQRCGLAPAVAAASDTVVAVG